MCSLKEKYVRISERWWVRLKKMTAKHDIKGEGQLRMGDIVEEALKEKYDKPS